jgi:hypothetical protein
VDSGFHGVESILDAEVPDLAALPGIGDAASTILEAARGEVLRRQVMGQPLAEEHGN